MGKKDKKAAAAAKKKAAAAAGEGAPAEAAAPEAQADKVQLDFHERTGHNAAKVAPPHRLLSIGCSVPLVSIGAGCSQGRGSG